MQKQGGGAYDVSCGCDMKNPLPAYAFSLEAARDVKGGSRRKTRKQPKQRKQRAGACGCAFKGGYKATKQNRKYLANYHRGKSIGFTMEASLKAKGLLPRTSKKNYGKKVLGNKYK